MKKGSIFQDFGCTWIVDDVYTVPAAQLMSRDNPYGLTHRKRLRAHVIEAPEEYKGIREIDAGMAE